MMSERASSAQFAAGRCAGSDRFVALDCSQLWKPRGLGADSRSSRRREWTRMDRLASGPTPNASLNCGSEGLARWGRDGASECASFGRNTDPGARGSGRGAGGSGRRSAQRWWAIRRHRGKCWHRQDPPPRRGARDRRLGEDAGARRPRRRVRGRVRLRDRPSAVRAAARVRGSDLAELLSGPAALVEPLLGASQSAPSQDAPPAEGSFAILHGLYWLAANVAFHQPLLRGRRPALGGHALAAVAPLPDAKARGVPLLVAAAARPPEGESAIPRSLQSSSPIRKPPRFAPNRLAVPRSPHSRRSCTVWSPTRPSAPPSRRRQAKPAIHRCGARRGCTGGNQPTAGHVPRLLEIGAKGVSRAVGLRLARLPPEALALLRAASILGDGTELRHAAALPAWKRASLARRPPPLVQLDLLHREDPLEFFHPVVRRRVRDARCG